MCVDFISKSYAIFVEKDNTSGIIFIGEINKKISLTGKKAFSYFSLAISFLIFLLNWTREKNPCFGISVHFTALQLSRFFLLDFLWKNNIDDGENFRQQRKHQNINNNILLQFFLETWNHHHPHCRIKNAMSSSSHHVSSPHEHPFKSTSPTTTYGRGW